MLLEIALGDAYGRPFEFNAPEFVKKYNTGQQYLMRNMDEPEELFGTYTDDTQMSIALAEHILNKRVFSLDSVASSFVNTYQRDPHAGYSKRMIAAFQASMDKPQPGIRFFNACQTSEIVSSNGTVMRSVPLGVMPTEGHVIRAAQIQSLITHCSNDASMCSQLIALTSHYFYYRKHGGDLSYNNYLEYLDAFSMYDVLNLCDIAFAENEEDIIPCDAKITTAAVIKVLFTAKTMTEVLVKSVAFCGDVDSVASVASGIASLKDDITTDYTKHIIVGLENEKYGNNYLCKLDRDIEEEFPRD